MFEISKSSHDMLCIQIEVPAKKVSDFLRSIVMNNIIASDDYYYSRESGAFLQCDYEEYILIEFWRKDAAHAFIDYANKKWEAESKIIEVDNSTEYECFLNDPETCNYCGNRFDDKRCTHSTCGLG
jgi:hypothetical protein